MAMAIVATILMALLALLPYGMDNIRQAKNTQILSRIGNEIVSEIQAVDWGLDSNFSRLSSYDGRTRFYDAEGILISSESNSNAETIYQARIDVDTSPLRLPGTSEVRDYLRKVTIKVAFSPGETTVDWDSTVVPAPYKTFVTDVVMLARTKISSSN
jgi:uncharacterized protein (TIGR02598 family)